MNPPYTPPPKKHRPRGMELIYEDRDVIVINKEPGLLTMSYRADETRTAENFLTRYVRKGAARSPHRAWLVHRLDRETSGLLVFARTETAQQKLKDGWKTVDKFYLAAVHGSLPQKTGVLSSHLAEDDDQFVHSVDNPEGGRLSQTAYSVIKESRGVSLLKIRLLTGRKNQIRVQFTEAGHPVCGDQKYGRPDRFPQLALHAKQLAFNHPHHGRRMEFTAPTPELFGVTDAEWNAAPQPPIR